MPLFVIVLYVEKMIHVVSNKSQGYNLCSKVLLPSIGSTRRALNQLCCLKNKQAVGYVDLIMCISRIIPLKII